MSARPSSARSGRPIPGLCFRFFRATRLSDAPLTDFGRILLPCCEHLGRLDHNGSVSALIDEDCNAVSDAIDMVDSCTVNVGSVEQVLQQPISWLDFEERSRPGDYDNLLTEGKYLMCHFV